MLRAARLRQQPEIDRLAGGIAALLELFAAQPSYAALGFIESRLAGDRSRALYRSGTRVLASMLDMQRRFLAPGVNVPLTAAQAALGGAQALVCDALLAGRAAHLPELLPDAGGSTDEGGRAWGARLSS